MYSHRFSTWFLMVTNSNLQVVLVRICLKRINFSFDEHAGTAHTNDPIYLVCKNSPRWRQVCTVIRAPTGEVEHFLKKFKCITTAAESSKWDNKVMKWQPATSSLMSYQKDSFTWKTTVQNTRWILLLCYACYVHLMVTWQKPQVCHVRTIVLKA
jgi:hypothetical protein